MQDDNKGKHNFEIYTTWEKLVSDYTGINILEIGDLNIVDFLVYRHDAFIRQMEQTPKGEEYLNNAWRLQQTQPDRQSLRDKFSKK